MLMDDPHLRPLDQYLQAQWQDNIGVMITWERIEVGVWEHIVRALYDTPREGEPPHLYRFGWIADYPDPDNFLRIGLAERWTRWHHDGYAQLVEQARHTTVQRERLKLYAQADRILIEEAVILPLLYRRKHLFVKPWMKKYPTSAIRDWFWKDVVIEPH
jgi:oligopeptide transport system substrate-binding protein